MDFHYEQNGIATGPVFDAEFERLVQAGTITPETLVWHVGLPAWQPFNTLPRPPTSAASLATTPLPTPAEGVICAECGQRFPTSEVISYGNFHVCAACKPAFFQKVKEGVRPSAALIWRDGKTLVTTSGTDLPDRCIKCNAPANGRRLKRTLYYHHPAIYLLLLCNLLIFAIVALIVRKRAILQIGLCELHFVRRKRNLLLSWLLALAGALMIVGAASYGVLWLGVTGGFVILGAAIYGLATTPMVSAKRIEGDRAWVRGVCRDYLDTLPTWTGE